MKRFMTIAVLAVLFGSAAYAGVTSISQSGTSATGKTMYEVKCSNGNTYRLYRSNGQWYEGGLGAIGGDSRSLSQEAQVVCR